MIPLLCALSISSQTPQELYNYLSKKDSSFAVTSVKTDARGTTIAMTSQTWQGIPWRHTILLRQPAQLGNRGTGILYITGDGPRDGDYRDIGLMSAATGMPVAMLFNVPNQPLWNMREDDLIAHTFQQYLKTSDPTWPLLFPMTKSALRAMDAVQAATRDGANPIKKFVVTGASKRGWTTWFVGAAKDPRVIGIAPMVYDNLNVVKQMPHQIQTWGAYSDMIQDYTRRGLQQQLATAKGKKLGTMIDPFAYRSNIRVPTLIVKGANDPYWTADATSLYWKELRQPHWLLTVPNAGHDLGGGILAAATIGAFARSLAGEFTMPKIDAKISKRDLKEDEDEKEEREREREREREKGHQSGSHKIEEGEENEIEVPREQLHWTFDVPKDAGPKAATLIEANLWAAGSESLDFRKSSWKQVDKVVFGEDDEIPTPGARYVRNAKRPEGNVATYVEFRFRANGKPFSLCTPIQVIKE